MDDGVVLDRVQNDVGTNYIPPEDFTYIQRTAGGLVGRMSIEISKMMTDLYGEQGIKLRETIELITAEDIKTLQEFNKSVKTTREFK